MPPQAGADPPCNCGSATLAGRAQVKDGKTFLDLIAEQVKVMRREYGSNVKFILMDSFSTSDDTREFLGRAHKDLLQVTPGGGGSGWKRVGGLGDSAARAVAWWVRGTEGGPAGGGGGDVGTVGWHCDCAELSRRLAGRVQTRRPNLRGAMPCIRCLRPRPKRGCHRMHTPVLQCAGLALLTAPTPFAYVQEPHIELMQNMSPKVDAATFAPAAYPDDRDMEWCAGASNTQLDTPVVGLGSGQQTVEGHGTRQPGSARTWLPMPSCSCASAWTSLGLYCFAPGCGCEARIRVHRPPCASPPPRCPPGHGDIYPSLLGSGMLDALVGEGIKYLFVSNSDNLGATLDLQLLQHFASSGAPFMMEVCERTAADKKGGHLARRKADGGPPLLLD